MFKIPSICNAKWTALFFLIFATAFPSDLPANPDIISSTNLKFFTNITSGGSIIVDQTICFGEDPSELTSSAPASGGNNSLPIEYLWLKSVPGVSGWEPISGATGQNYDPPALNQTTAFMRCARRMGFPNYTGESNPIIITVLSSPFALIIEAPMEGNDGDVLTFAASDYPFATYSWDFGDGTILNGTSVDHVYNFGGTYTVVLTVTDNFTGCSYVTSTEIFILGPLPVELGYFYGEPNEDKEVILFWYTEREEENNYFEILKSVDGEKFEVIGIVEGQGNSDLGTAYKYTDDIPFIGVNYYQLRQIDFSGEFSFSPVIAIGVEKEGLEEYTLYPNPATDKLNIRFRDTYEEEMLISIFDVNRKLVKQFHLPAQTIKSNFDIADISPGVYSINIHSRRIRANSLFVKIGL